MGLCGPYFLPFATFGVSRPTALRVLLSAEAEPDEIESPAHSDQEADEGQIASIEELISCPADATPKEEARDHISEDRPEGVIFAATIAGLVGHAAMVDEF